jgi:hypothetical protein
MITQQQLISYPKDVDQDVEHHNHNGASVVTKKGNYKIETTRRELLKFNKYY